MKAIIDYFQDGNSNPFRRQRMGGCPHYVGKVTSVVKGTPDIPVFYIDGDLDRITSQPIKDAVSQLNAKGCYIFCTGSELVALEHSQFIPVNAQASRVIAYR